MNNNQWLAEFIDTHGLTRANIADALSVSNSTVDRWLQPKTRKRKKNPTYRGMPDMAKALLEYRLADGFFSQGA